MQNALLSAKTEEEWARAKTRKATGIQFISAKRIPESPVRLSPADALQLAADRLHDAPIYDRGYTAYTMAIDPNLILEAPNAIPAYERKLGVLREIGDRIEVYQVNIPLFSLTPIAERPNLRRPKS